MVSEKITADVPSDLRSGDSVMGLPVVGASEVIEKQGISNSIERDKSNNDRCG